MTKPGTQTNQEGRVKHTDIIIMTTDVREVIEDGHEITRFQVQIPGRATEGQASSLDVRGIRKTLAAWEASPPSLTAVVALGKLLGDALFPTGQIRDIVLASVAAHRNLPDSRLRLLLNLSDSLHSIPWEFVLLHTEPGEATQNQMLGLMSQVSIVRQLDRVVPNLVGTKAATLPAQLVMALADPTGKLKLKKERKVVKKSLDQSDRINITYVQPVTANDLFGGRDHVDIFHFAGHGQFVTRPTPGKPFGKGALMLDDGNGGADLLDATVLAPQLVKAGVRVAFLGACLTAKRDDEQLWSSTAANLLNGGLGAVVAMQFAVLDTSAIAFSGAFYSAVALGYPVDQAVTEGRIAIFATRDFRGFGTPVLYMGSSDGVLFPTLTNDPALQTERQQQRAVVTVDVKTIGGEVTGLEVGTMAAGDAEVRLKSTTIEDGAIAIGAIIDTFTGGNLSASANVEKVEKGGKLVVTKIDRLG